MRPGQRPVRPRAKIQRSQLENYYSRNRSTITNTTPEKVKKEATTTTPQQINNDTIDSSQQLPDNDQIDVSVLYNEEFNIITEQKKKPKKKKNKPKKTRTKSKRKIKIILLLSVILLLFATSSAAYGYFVYSENKKANQADKLVAQQFIQNLKDKDTSKGYELTSQGFRDSATKEQLEVVMLQIQPYYLGNMEIFDQWHDGKNIKDSNSSIIVYHTELSGDDYYLKFVLEKVNNEWKILNIESKNAELKAELPSQAN